MFALDRAVVATDTTIGVAAVPDTVAGLGATLQVDAAGAPVQVNETEPVNPAAGAMFRLNLAAPPAAVVAEVVEPGAGPTSKSGGTPGGALKLAVTDFAASMVKAHAPVPVQAPPQPANSEPLAGVAVSATTVPLGKAAEQTAPQSIPAGLLVTFPAPVPPGVTVSAN